MARYTMRQKAEQEMKNKLHDAWETIVEETNDGRYHSTHEIANKFNLQIGEVASNLSRFRDGLSSKAGSFPVKSVEIPLRYVRIDMAGEVTGDIIYRKGYLGWKLGDAPTPEKSDIEKMVEAKRGYPISRHC